MRFQTSNRATFAVLFALSAIACGSSANPAPGSMPQPAAAPVIIGFRVDVVGTLDHRLLTIVGGGFQAGASVTFSGVKGTNVAVDPSGASIICITPSLAPGSVSVDVTNPDGQSATFTGSDAAAAPEAQGGSTSGAPGSPYQFGGSRLSSPKVFFGTVQAPIVSTTGLPPILTVTVNVPSLASGTYEVVIVNADGQFATVEPTFVVP